LNHENSDHIHRIRFVFTFSQLTSCCRFVRGDYFQRYTRITSYNRPILR